MIILDVRNVNAALTRGIALVKERGVMEQSRNGPVLRIPEPVTTVYRHPEECVLFAPARDANPFFHCVEALWLLAGRDDLKSVTPYVKRMAEFSDDGGVTQPGSYGKRWRDHFPGLGDEQGHFPTLDQLNWVVGRLRKDPSDRRCVISMWDAGHDPVSADLGGRDVPCNISVLPYVSDGRLSIVVTCRSNDMVLGAYGANAVHFSMLLSYLAGRIGLPVGTYTQVSVNFHCYLSSDIQEEVYEDPYVSGLVQPYSMWTDWEEGEPSWDRPKHQLVDDTRRERILQEDLKVFFDHGAVESATKARMPWLRRVAVPMALAHQYWRTGRGEARYTGALDILERVAAPDWRLAASQWVQRRYDRWKVKVDDGVSHAD